MRCDRCGAETDTFKMSWFNTEMICTDCQTKESLLPEFKHAKEVELSHVLSGDYNFIGVGYPR